MREWDMETEPELEGLADWTHDRLVQTLLNQAKMIKELDDALTIVACREALQQARLNASPEHPHPGRITDQASLMAVLKQARINSGMKQTEMAENLQLSSARMSQVESGGTKDLYVVFRYARALGGWFEFKMPGGKDEVR